MTLPNGLFDSVYVASLRFSDAGLLNMSSLYTHLRNLFHKFDMVLRHAGNQFTGRYSSPDLDKDRVNTRMAVVCPLTNTNSNN